MIDKLKKTASICALAGSLAASSIAQETVKYALDQDTRTMIAYMMNMVVYEPRDSTKVDVSKFGPLLKVHPMTVQADGEASGPGHAYMHDLDDDGHPDFMFVRSQQGTPVMVGLECRSANYQRARAILGKDYKIRIPKPDPIQDPKAKERSCTR